MIDSRRELERRSCCGASDGGGPDSDARASAAARDTGPFVSDDRVVVDGAALIDARIIDDCDCTGGGGGADTGATVGGGPYAIDGRPDMLPRSA